MGYFLIWITILTASVFAMAHPKLGTPTNFRLRSFRVTGTGCSQSDGVTFDLDHDLKSMKGLTLGFENNTLNVLFDTDEIRAMVGDQAVPVSQRRACTMRIRFAYDRGWQLALNTFGLETRMDTVCGVKGQVVMKNFVSGLSDFSSHIWNFADPVHGTASVNIPDRLQANSTLGPATEPAYATSISSLYSMITPDGKIITDSAVSNSNKSPATIKDTPHHIFSRCSGDASINLKVSIALQQNVNGARGSIDMRKASAGFIWRRCSNAP